jgi:hypothetical protein
MSMLGWRGHDEGIPLSWAISARRAASSDIVERRRERRSWSFGGTSLMARFSTPPSFVKYCASIMMINSSLFTSARINKLQTMIV